MLNKHTLADFLFYDEFYQGVLNGVILTIYLCPTVCELLQLRDGQTPPKTMALFYVYLNKIKKGTHIFIVNCVYDIL